VPLRFGLWNLQAKNLPGDVEPDAPAVGVDFADDRHGGTQVRGRVIVIAA
jgi:hypothetical protein